jgi:integrase
VETTYDVRIYKTEVYRGAKTTTYWVRWRVAGQNFKEPFKQRALADSFRSDLVSAARKGEAFVVATGRPVSMQRESRDMTCYDLACSYVDLKWPRVAAMTRKTIAEALTAAVPQLFARTKGKPEDRLIRTALRRWAFNTPARTDDAMPPEIRSTLSWVARNSRPATDLLDPEILRRTLDSLTLRLDGKPGSPVVVLRRRKVFTAMLEHAVEVKALRRNPWVSLKWTPPRATNGAVDRRRVVNPMQARTLLVAVGEQGRIGPRMVAFYSCLYYAGLRPEEAVGVEVPRNLSLPDSDDEWGEFVLETAEPHAGRAWTDSGNNRDRRQLKQRAIGEVRRAPCPPVLTGIIRWHVREFGLGPGGRLFVGERNKAELPVLTINRVWRRARAAAFTPQVYASPLAETPYDLRHAFVSTMLNTGVSPAQVAEWAGQSPEVLWRIYAKCLDGGQTELRRRITEGYGGRPSLPGFGTYSAQILGDVR